MNLLEVTLTIGIALAIAAAGMTQMATQAQTILYYKDVDYYSREVPRTVAAMHNLARGVHTFRIGNATTDAPAGGAGARFLPPNNSPNFLSGRGLPGNGDALYMRGTYGGTNVKEAIVWLVDNSRVTAPETGRVASLFNPITQERTFADNRFDIFVSVRTNSVGSWPSGWVLNKQVSGLRFDIIPDAGGAVLMTVFKRMRGEGAAEISYQVVLERR